MSKVFISSTVFDLLDVRAEVTQLLHDMRLVPVASGIATSAFQPLPDQNSIETCLANLRQCDAVIVILCQRYGPSLEKTGFPDLSATHLEYTEAKRLGKPIRMYIRDRLDGDYRIYLKNRKSDVQFRWVQDEKDRRLFELMDEHLKLAKGRPGSNWYDTFRDSVELKTLLNRDFGPLAARNELEALVVDNRIPIIAVSIDVTPPQDSRDWLIRIGIKNVGTVPAYRLTWNVVAGENQDQVMPVLAPQQETCQAILYTMHRVENWESTLNMTYYMPQGHRIVDEYELGIRFASTLRFWSGAQCKSKTYHVATDGVRPFVIAELDESVPTGRIGNQ